MTGLYIQALLKKDLSAPVRAVSRTNKAYYLPAPNPQPKYLFGKGCKFMAALTFSKEADQWGVILRKTWSQNNSVSSG